MQNHELSEGQLFKALELWYIKYYQHKTVNKWVKPYLVDSIQPNQKGWLKKSRLALFLSTTHIANELKISRAAYCKLEKNEELGVVSLNTLSKAAEAMDCELVYAIRPKKKKLFCEVIWEKLLPASINHRWVKSRPQLTKHNALAYIAETKMKDPEFRRQKGWSEHKGQKLND